MYEDDFLESAYEDSVDMGFEETRDDPEWYCPTRSRPKTDDTSRSTESGSDEMTEPVIGDWYEATYLPNDGREVVRVVKIENGEVFHEGRNYIGNSWPVDFFRKNYQRIVEDFSCLTCALSVKIDLSDVSGKSDDAAESEHMRHDGAHRGNWISEIDGNDPYERRLQNMIDTDHMMDGDW